MRLPFLALALLTLSACAGSPSQRPQDDARHYTDAGYGLSALMPIRVQGLSGGGSGPADERAYLDALQGPEGQTVTYEREGSCCGFESSNSPYGVGLLDMYRVTYRGAPAPVLLYLNMYDPATRPLEAPSGFVLAGS